LPQPFVIDIFGNNVDQLRELADQTVARLRPIRALTGIFNNDGYLITELQIIPRPDALPSTR